MNAWGATEGKEHCHWLRKQVRYFPTIVYSPMSDLAFVRSVSGNFVGVLDKTDRFAMICQICAVEWSLKGESRRPGDSFCDVQGLSGAVKST